MAEQDELNIAKYCGSMAEQDEGGDTAAPLFAS